MGSESAVFTVPGGAVDKFYPLGEPCTQVLQIYSTDNLIQVLQIYSTDNLILSHIGQLVKCGPKNDFVFFLLLSKASVHRSTQFLCQISQILTLVWKR